MLPRGSAWTGSHGAPLGRVAQKQIWITPCGEHFALRRARRGRKAIQRSRRTGSRKRRNKAVEVLLGLPVFGLHLHMDRDKISIDIMDDLEHESGESGRTRGWVVREKKGREQAEADR